MPEQHLSLRDLPEPVRWALCVHELFRRCGHLSDNIYVHLGDVDGRERLGVEVRQDSMSFLVLFDETVPNEAFAAQWQSAVTTWNAADGDHDLEIVWHDFLMHYDVVGLLKAMKRKGLWATPVVAEEA